MHSDGKYWSYRLVEETGVVRLREVHFEDWCPVLMTTSEVTIIPELGDDLNWFAEKVSKAVMLPVIKYPFGPQQLELAFD